MIREGDEPITFVQCASFLIDCIYNYGDRSDAAAVFQSPMQSIHDQHVPDPTPLELLISG